MQNRACKNQQWKGKVDKNLLKSLFCKVIAVTLPNDYLGKVRENCFPTDFFSFFAENFVFESVL